MHLSITGCPALAELVETEWPCHKADQGFPCPKFREFKWLSVCTCFAWRSISLTRYTRSVPSFVNAVLGVCSRPIGLSCSVGATTTCIPCIHGNQQLSAPALFSLRYQCEVRRGQCRTWPSHGMLGRGAVSWVPGLSPRTVGRAIESAIYPRSVSMTRTALQPPPLDLAHVPCGLKECPLHRGAYLGTPRVAFRGPLKWLLPVLLVLESCYSQDKQPGGLDTAQSSARRPREDTLAIQSKRLSVDI